MPSKIKFRL